MEISESIILVYVLDEEARAVSGDSALQIISATEVTAPIKSLTISQC